MKKILFLLLFTIASYGQAVFDEGIQITGNANSGTATKVNVQEANGKVNTQTINTAFNKNFGLNSGDVVGANTLLNQYSTTPVDWTATTFASGQVVFYAGKQWIAKTATVAGDVPAVSLKWEEITFEALANKTVTVDQTIIDGSTNAVSGNAVFDGLALKSNIGHTHVASQITDLSKASVGLGNVDNTSDLSKPLSTATINALATKAPISSVHNPVTIGTANGLSLSTQQLSLGLASSSTTGALSGTDWDNFNSKQPALGFTPENVANKATTLTASSTAYPNNNAVIAGLATKEPSFTKNTAFNKNFGTTAGTVAEGNDSRINNGQTAFSWGNHVNGGYAFTTGSNINQSSFRTALGLGSNAYTSTAYLPLSGGDINGLLKITRDGYQLGIAGTDQGAVDLYKLGALGHRLFSDAGSFGIYDLENDITVLSIAKATRAATFAGTISASPATTANQVPTWGQVQANARPYKVYTALYSQSSTSNPTAIVLENTLGTVTFTRSSTGVYSVNSSGLFTADKTFVIMGAGINANYTNAITLINSSTFYIITKVSSTQSDADSANTKVAFEIRVYN